jgi:protein import protein ZIM17
MLMMMFTCGQCETRAAKAFSKVAYTRGVVLLECPGCSVRHVVADHLGWFGAKGTVEDFAAERGGAVVSRLADNTLEITPEEVAGAAAVGRLRDGAAAAEP